MERGSKDKAYLTVNILLFLAPFALLKREYAEAINKCLYRETWYQKHNIVKDIIEHTVFVYWDGVYLSNVVMYIVAAVSVLFGIGGLIVLTEKYLTIYQKMMKGVERFERGELVINGLTKGSKRPVEIRVYLCDGLRTPITIGIVHGKIILPAVAWEDKKLEDILRHELTHVRAKDNLVKVILVFVVFLNFYNPLVYYLLYRWNLAAEMYCDYKVTENKGLRETGSYIKLLIDFAENQKTGTMPIAGLNMSEKQLKERVENMKRLKKTGKKYGKMSRAAGVIITAAAIFVSSLTVYAYEERQIQYCDTESYEKVASFYLYSDSERDGQTALDTKYDAYEEYANDNNVIFFVSETGEVHYDVYTVADQLYIACSHTYSSGTAAKHVKDGKGGCKMEYYDGKWCTKCGHIVYGDFVKASVYAVCPH